MLRRVALLVWMISACGGGVDHRGDPSLDAELRLSPTPPMVGTAGVRVEARDGSTGLTPPGEVSVAVSGAPGPPTALEFEAGAWVGLLDFPRPGEARVQVRITTADGRSAVLGVPVRVARRP